LSEAAERLLPEQAGAHRCWPVDWKEAVWT
jgi:hypothetical protein